MVEAAGQREGYRMPLLLLPLPLPSPPLTASLRPRTALAIRSGGLRAEANSEADRRRRGIFQPSIEVGQGHLRDGKDVEDSYGEHTRKWSMEMNCRKGLKRVGQTQPGERRRKSDHRHSKHSMVEAREGGGRYGPLYGKERGLGGGTM
jgi:hypothetical protein